MSSSSSSINLTPSINGTDDLIADLLKFFFEPDDPRVKQWFLAGSPVPLFTIVGVYLVFCLRAGPWFMRNRKPFELKNTLLIYNGLQVILSCVLFYEFYQAGWGTHYNYKCEPLVFKTDPQSLRMARAVWLFYIAKITELLDTVFFVLRKKDRQISTLHLYHHTIMPLGLYFAVQNFAAGHGTVICFVNSFVHIVMYTYYMLAALGPKIQKYLWWKKYITILQMMARAVWLYYIAKITELLDTVFFVLRKRDRQITFLHLYHHASMPFVSLIGVQYYAGGHGTIVCFVNSFIHIVMYAYYLLAAMGPKVQKYLWWKKYITMMQIVQFLIVFVHTFQVQFQPTCHYPKLIAIGLSLNASLFIYLFSSFYIQSYKKDAVQNGVKKAVSQKQD
ncbi:elongation of very long chain fatty acids protein 7-like [Stomoxys calcitrans]|uniref:elongation of very long chain fatty acids protein 7-like n=1 Tax=Stomoxys calcitrans TaxID=35570 RepID=UPI0027E21B48|nr:elongation of very long chain fatty acids protein 7-like [Stomoxys calcitrans]